MVRVGVKRCQEQGYGPGIQEPIDYDARKCFLEIAFLILGIFFSSRDLEGFLIVKALAIIFFDVLGAIVIFVEESWVPSDLIQLIGGTVAQIEEADKNNKRKERAS